MVQVKRQPSFLSSHWAWWFCQIITLPFSFWKPENRYNGKICYRAQCVMLFWSRCAMWMHSACKYSLVWQNNTTLRLPLFMCPCCQTTVCFFHWLKGKNLCFRIYLSRICKTHKTWQMQTLQNIMLNVLATAWVDCEHQWYLSCRLATVL